ncbi:hypothetical protein HYALB_00009603 [Hymenoscyphus albidus]|uniref:Rhodopsin domain-containing protein n=1 Tax=Hymenoscyphus albidus TaxID=595503 RepID=A0A9N9QBL5_9HELO|nr:hypothetical protein HYALB_00009603 [Hymenoscyphus albidus]
MGNFDSSFVSKLAVESWSLYGVIILMFLLRMYARIHRLGIGHLQIDDYVMILAGCSYTVLVVCLNITFGIGGSNLYPPEQFDSFTPEDIKERIQGSKLVVVSEQAMLNVIYCVKACMLILYTRLPLSLYRQRLVTCLSVYVLLGWLGTQIAFFTACRPFSGYWAMPPPSSQCATLKYYAIVQGCFNISSDSLILLIPLPLITRLNVPWRHRLVLSGIFGLGIFVIIGAILATVFNFEHIYQPTYMLCYMRESSVAIYVANIPLIWPLLKEKVPGMKNFTPGHKSGYSASQSVYEKRDNMRRGSERIRAEYEGDFDDYSEMGSTVTTKIRGNDQFCGISAIKQPGHLVRSYSERDFLHINTRGDIGSGIHLSTTTIQVCTQTSGKNETISPQADLESYIPTFPNIEKSESRSSKFREEFSDTELG